MAENQARLILSSQTCKRFFDAATIACFTVLIGTNISGAQSVNVKSIRSWDAEIALGGNFSTGNTDRKALDIDAKASHRNGPFEDHYRLSGEFVREKDKTTAARINGKAQSNYDISNRFYALGFAEVERDKFSGFRYETEIALGLGYRIINMEQLSLEIELAPAFRHGAIKAGGNNNKMFARGSAMLEYNISDTATLTNESAVSGQSGQFRAENTLALTATLVSSLAARISFNIRYNSHPPARIKKTDTISKVQLVYGF